jgi:DNA-binding HxlR family transcriptional regulator
MSSNAATPPQARPASRARRKSPRGDLFAAACPSRQILNHVTGRWGSLVLVALLDGTQRFSALRRRIDGVSERMLAQSLQDLEADGFVHRHVHPVMPPHVDYSLTPMGQEIGLHVRELAEWVEANLPRIQRHQQEA